MRFTSFTSPWVRLKIATRTGIEFSPVMRTKARGTAALKPSPVRSAESHGHGPVCLSPVSPSCSLSPLPPCHVLFLFLLWLLSHYCVSVSIFFLRTVSVILFFFAISLFLIPPTSLAVQPPPSVYLLLSVSLSPTYLCLCPVFSQRPSPSSFPVSCVSFTLIIARPPRCILLIGTILILTVLICLVIKRLFEVGGWTTFRQKF